MVREAQLRATGRLAGEALTGLVATVGDVHRAISRRVQHVLPPGGRAVVALQSGFADLVYSGVTLGVKIVPDLTAGWLVRGGGNAPALTDTVAGSAAVAAINGLWGDVIASHHVDLAVPPVLRVQCRDLLLHRIQVGGDVPDPTDRIVVFIHGLTENDRSWWRDWAAEPAGPTSTYGARLRADLGYTPVYFHYNSGLRVCDNGRALAAGMDRLAGIWPVPVERIALVGHSMGGLVARSACHHAELDGHPWLAAVGSVVTLGTPHLGAPLEQAVHVAEQWLSVVPESAPFARLLGSRSAGVRDLRFGALVEDHLHAADGSGPFRDGFSDLPLLEHIKYHFVSASVGRDHRHPAGWLLGDGLVRVPSAAATGRNPQAPFAPHSRAHFWGLHHFSLLNHPEVYAQLRCWLADGLASDSSLDDVVGRRPGHASRGTSPDRTAKAAAERPRA